MHALGGPRQTTTVKINTCTDKYQTLENKVASVQALLSCRVPALLGSVNRRDRSRQPLGFMGLRFCS